MIRPVSNPDFPSCLLAAYTVCQAQNREIIVRLMNTSNVNVEVHAGQKDSDFCPLVEHYDPHSCQESEILNTGLMQVLLQLSDSILGAYLVHIERVNN